VDRTRAETILKRIPSEQTVFMVRCSTDGGYAISIKYKDRVDHIKVVLCTNVSTNGITYSIDNQNKFVSLDSLVEFYSINLLSKSFSQLDTTLGVPFRDALPVYKNIGLALYDYVPPSNADTVEIELKKGCKYFILEQEENGWCKVYNTDGLIGYVPEAYLST
jgi:hypothetical protein